MPLVNDVGSRDKSSMDVTFVPRQHILIWIKKSLPLLPSKFQYYEDLAR